MILDAAIVVAFFVGATAVGLVIASRDERRRHLELDDKSIDVHRRFTQALASTYATPAGAVTPAGSNTSRGVSTAAVPVG